MTGDGHVILRNSKVAGQFRWFNIVVANTSCTVKVVMQSNIGPFQFCVYLESDLIWRPDSCTQVGWMYKSYNN